jgi:glycerol kinase
MRYVLAIDQGTTSSRCVIYNERLEVVGQGQEAFPQHFPKADWVEHDLGEIWTSVERATRSALASVPQTDFHPSKIVAIGITNQRETFGLWDKKTHQPAGPAIVWQCRRSAEICAKLGKTAAGRKLAALTGLVLDPYFSGTKLHWWLSRSADVARRAKAGELAFGTIDTFLIWKLTGGASHVTDVTNASRTLLMDLKTRRWSPHALKTLKVPASILPDILDSNAPFGVTRGLGFLPEGIPICGVLGDQQAALFGQACFKPGEAKVTYGTGAFLLLNTGPRIRKTKNGVSTVAWSIDGKAVYALESSVFIAGAAVQWLRDGLKLIGRSSDMEALARQVPDSDGVYFIPALSGLGAPHWAPHARGVIGGLTRRTQQGHVARATLEGIAASVGDSFDGLARDAGSRIKSLRADGGAAANDLLLQSQADYLQVRIERPRDLESTARGAASMAALGSGLITGLGSLKEANPVEKSVAPSLSSKKARELKQIWSRRVKALIQGGY